MCTKTITFLFTKTTYLTVQTTRERPRDRLLPRHRALLERLRREHRPGPASRQPGSDLESAHDGL